MLGHDRGHMSVVVLDRDLARLGSRQRVAGRLVVGVQIVGDDLRLDTDETLQARHRVFVGCQGFQLSRSPMCGPR